MLKQEDTAARAPDRVWTGLGVILVCFFLSGATGLIYQVIWLRMLGLVFGHTVYAITTVLAAFMAGLALGSFLMARRAARIKNLVRAYGWLEIGIGVSCAVLPLLLWAAARVYVASHHALGLSYDAFSALQFLLVFCLLLVPTTLMGGTLPVLSQALVTQDTGAGRTVGTLYAVNTFGAVVGVVLAGYVLLPTWGNSLTIAVAVIGNLAVGALAIAYSRRVPAPGVRDAAAPAGGPATPRREARRAASAVGEVGQTLGRGAWLTVLGLGVSGAVSMIYEVSWTRALALVIGSSTYAFTAMLVAFLVGIAGGSALYSWLAGDRRPSPAAFAGLQAGIGVAVALVVLVFERVPEVFIVALQWSASPGFVQFVQLVVSAGALLLFTLLIGATFPCAVAVAARGAARIGRDVGDIYAVNTVGAIVGAVAAGFWLIPAIGVHASIRAGIAINLALAALLFVAAPRPAGAWAWSRAGAALAGAVVVLFLPPWDPRVMSSGPAIYWRSYLRTTDRSLADSLRVQQLLFYRDGRSGTVSVNRVGEHLYLRINGKSDAGTSGDMATQLMFGHLPLLLHPDPKAVLVIGLGTGMTAGAVARHPVERLDVAEIEPAVVEASRFFAHIHGNVLRDPRVRTVIADGRNFLLTTPRRYDAIVSEPSNPWISGLASLFSVEFFQLAREHLQPGGLMVQWLQGYSLSADDLRMVVRTFRTVFPATSIWNTSTGDFLLVGRVESRPVDLTLLKSRYDGNPGLRADLARLGLKHWAGVLGFFMLGEADTARFAEGSGLNTDDRLPLEFSAPRSLYANTAGPNWRLIRGFSTAELPAVTPEGQAELERAEVRHWIGVGYYLRGAFDDALMHFERAMRLDPEHLPARLGASGAHLRLGRPAEALDLARQVLARQPSNEVALYVAGLASEAVGATSEAVGFLERAVALQPQNAEFRAALARASATGR